MMVYQTAMFEEVWESLPAHGWLTKPEARLLWETCSKVRPFSVLEVGCYQGRSTVLLASRATRVFSVDPFDGFTEDLTGEEICERFLQNMRERKITNVFIFKQKIEDWTPRPCQLAYLDGDHTAAGTVFQIEKALACKPKVICVHDVNDSGDGAEVKRAALEMLGPWEQRVGRLATWRLGDSL